MPADDDAVEPFVRKAAAWSWRLLVILAAMLALLWLIQRLQVIVVPLALAVMVTALMAVSYTHLTLPTT